MFLSNNTCSADPVCNTTRYSYTARTYDFSEEGNDSRLMFRLMDLYVEHYETFVNYKFPNFMSDVGGFVGITLGASAMSIVLFCIKFIK